MKTFAVSLALAIWSGAALTLTPTAHADMLVGNYRLDTDRDPWPQLDLGDSAVHS